MKKTIFIIALVASAMLAQAQTAKIIFIRNTGYNWGGAFRVFIDDKAVCKIQNKRFSIHQVPVGQHTVSAQITSTSPNKKTKEEALTITVEDGKEYYVTLVLTQGLVRNLFCEEVTATTWLKQKHKIQEEANCLE